MNQLNDSSRLLSIDVLRGMSVAGMIFVNNPGLWNHTYPCLLHAEWIGLTLADLVFPFFMFIMGISIALAFRKCNYIYSRSLGWKIAKRTVVLYLIGAGLSYLSHFWTRLGAPLPEGGSQWEHLLYSLQAWENTFKLGVMQRLAICYAGVAVLSLTLRHRLFPWVAGGQLAAYSVLLLVGNGYAYDASNWLGIVDRALLGVEHMPKIHHGLQPEGILSTLPAFAHTMLGFCVGKLLLKVKDNRRRIRLFFSWGAAGIGVGLLLSFLLPLCKKNWSPSFVLVTCGLALVLLAVLTWLIDVKNVRRWATFFHVFGVNPLFIYVLAALGAQLFAVCKLNVGGDFLPVSGFIVKVCLLPITDLYVRSLFYALFFVGLNWLAGYWLMKHKIFVKI